MIMTSFFFSISYTNLWKPFSKSCSVPFADGHCIFQRTAHSSTMVMSGVFPLVGTVTFSPFMKSDFALQIRGLPFVLNMDRGIGVSSYFNTSFIGVSLTLLINSNRLNMAPMSLVSLLPSADFSFFTFLAAVVTPLDMA